MPMLSRVPLIYSTGRVRPVGLTYRQSLRPGRTLQAARVPEQGYY